MPTLPDNAHDPEALAPCPFCGNVGVGGAVAKLHHILGHKHPKADEEKAFAYCTKCGATGPISDNAFRSWQTRFGGAHATQTR